MTRHPTRKSVALAEITSTSHYGARFFTPALARFVLQWRNPQWTSRQIEYHVGDFILPFDRLPVFHRIKFWNEAIYGKETVDAVHVHPRHSHDGTAGEVITPARFDTVLVRVRGVPEESSQTRTWTQSRSLNGTPAIHLTSVQKSHTRFQMYASPKSGLSSPFQMPPWTTCFPPLPVSSALPVILHMSNGSQNSPPPQIEARRCTRSPEL